MALYPLTESPFLKSPRLGSSSQKVETKGSFDSHLLKHSFTKNTFNNRTSLNMDRLSPVINSLSYYPSGFPIFVTYYSFIHNFTNKQTSTADYTNVIDNVNVCYKKICNLEIRLNSSMDFSFSDEDGEVEVNGSGKIYPGFQPHVGDIFLYETMPGQLGLFVITDVSPLSLTIGFQDTSFVLKEYISNETIARLEACVIETYYYDTMKSFGEKRIILNRDDYITYQNMISIRTDLIKLFFEVFYDNTLQTFMRKDEIYDGYIVDFMTKCLNYTDHFKYPPMQLINNRELKRSIWDNVLNKYTNLRLIDFKYCENVICRRNVLDAYISGIVNKKMTILTTDNTKEYYAFSEYFYNDDLDNMSEIERCIYTFIRTGTINPKIIETFITSLNTTNLNDYFYFIPATIYLINEILHSA